MARSSTLRARAGSTSGSRLAVGCAVGVLSLTAVAVASVAAGVSPSPGGAGFLVALVAASLLYAAGVLVLERRRAPLVAVLVLAAAIQLVPLAGPLLLSADARSYAAYGRIDASLGGNPYSDPPSAFVADPVARAVAGGWRETPSVYGPVFAATSLLVAAAAGDDPDAAVRLYRALAALSMLGLAVLAAALSGRPDRAAAFVGWNPLLAVHFAGGGHNDATMMLLVLGALVLLRRSHTRAGGALWAGAIAVKWVPAALWGLSALAARRRGSPTGLAAFAAAAAAIAAAATWRYGVDWATAVLPLARLAEVQTRYSTLRLLGAAGVPSAAAVALVAGAALLAGALLVRSALAGRARLGLAACALVALSPWVLPWYLVWPVSVAAVEREPHARLLSLALMGYLLPARISL